MEIRVLDIGGSGVKTTKLKFSDDLILQVNINVEHFPDPDWANFTQWLHKNNLIDSQYIGISSAGFIKSDSIVSLFRIGGWINKPIIDDIKELSPNAKVYILNDAESHLMAHAKMYDNPQMSISLGSSLGFAISNNEGKIIRPTDNMNFDLGAVKIPTSAKNKQVWWALGSKGLKELQNNLGETEGVIQYGYRLGSFLTDICSVFRPKTVVFSGGITQRWWETFSNYTINEFNHQKPDWLDPPKFIKSPYGKNAALIGIGKHVYYQQQRE